MNHHLNNHQINLIVNDQIYLVQMNPYNLYQHVQFRRNINQVYLVLEMMIHKQNEVHDKVYEVGYNKQIIKIVIDHLLP